MKHIFLERCIEPKSNQICRRSFEFIKDRQRIDINSDTTEAHLAGCKHQPTARNFCTTDLQNGVSEVADDGPLSGENREPLEDPGGLLRVQLEPRVHVSRQQEQLRRVQEALVVDRAPDLEYQAPH